MFENGYSSLEHLQIIESCTISLSTLHIYRWVLKNPQPNQEEIKRKSDIWSFGHFGK